MAEEHRCEAPEGHRLCANNCGFLGSPATMNFCSKCYGDFRLKEQQEASSMNSSSTTVFESVSVKESSSVSTVSIAPVFESVSVKESSSVSAVAIPPVSEPRSQQKQQQQQPNRCTVCRKRVGLTGFKCKCGIMFCGSHRYPENHGCTFDFKKVGRDEIARANPLIKAKKLVML